MCSSITRKYTHTGCLKKSAFKDFKEMLKKNKIKIKYIDCWSIILQRSFEYFVLKFPFIEADIQNSGAFFVQAVFHKLTRR